MHSLNHKRIRILRSDELPEAEAISLTERNNNNALQKWRLLYHKQQPPSQRATAQQESEAYTDLPEGSAQADDPQIEDETDGVNEVNRKTAIDDQSNPSFKATDLASSLLAPAASAVNAVEPAPSLPLPESLSRLVQRIQKFSSNPAVKDSGAWTMNVPIDPALLPGATLFLSVSHFELSLRFTVTDPDTKDLICLHKDALYQHLVKWTASRSVDTTVDITIFG